MQRKNMFDESKNYTENFVERRQHQVKRAVAIAATVASIGIFSPVTVPIIVYHSVKIAQANREIEKTNINMTAC